MNHEFEKAHAEWLESHLRRRTGERLERLKKGHGYLEKLLLEKVWWPAFGNFDHLHPEYEVRDGNGRYRYLDNAYLPPNRWRFNLEASGYNAHVSQTSRWKYDDYLVRDALLAADWWTVVHFSHDLIHDQAEMLIPILQRIVWSRTSARADLMLPPHYKEALRYAQLKQSPITPGELSKFLSISPWFARKILGELTQQGLMKPASGQSRIRSYELSSDGFKYMIF